MDNYEISDLEILEVLDRGDSMSLEELVKKYSAKLVNLKIAEVKKQGYIAHDETDSAWWLSKKGKEYLSSLRKDE